ILLRIANLARQRGKSGRDEAVRQFNEVLRLTAKASSMEAERAAREAHRGLLGVWLDEYADAERNRDRATMTAALRQARAHVQDPRDGVMVGLQELKMAGDNAARRKELLLELMDRYPTTRYEFPERGLMVVREYALIELAELAESVRWFDQALGHWQTLLETWPNEAYRGQTLHRYASQRQRNLIKQAGTRAYATIEAQAREALTAAVRSQSPSALQAIPARWPVSEAAQEALIELALYELAASTSSPDTDEHLDAATTALRQLTTDFPDTTWRPQAWVLLAEAYESRKMFHAARGVLLMLRRDYEGKTVALRNRQIEVNSYVDAILSRDIYKELASGGAVPRLTDPPLRLIATNTVDRGTNPSVLAPSGVVPAGAPARYFLLRNRRLECRDVETGDVVWTNYDSIYVYEIARVGPLIVVVTTGSVLGLDADSGEVRYRVDLDQQVQSATIEGATCAVIVRERRPSDNRILLTMYVISAEDGKVIGRTGGDGLETQMLGKPQIAGNMILLHSLSPGRVYGFVSTRPATPIYELSFEARLAAAPIMLDDRRFAVATRASAIEVMQLADGNLLRRIPVNGGILSDRVFATEKQIIYCDSTAKVISVDPATGAERWRHEFGRNDQLMQYSMVTPEGLLILHKSLTDQRKLLATSLDLETGERQWQTSLGEDLRFDCTVSQLTTGHIVLAMRKIDARMVDDNGQQRQEVSATLNVHILARRTGDMLQTITPDCGTTLIPSVVVQDGSLLVTSDSAVLRYGR
ncbi:MAG: PQQ-binding-like beta-propeller repeat protein, partial [Planctomycetota bacterium]